MWLRLTSFPSVHDEPRRPNLNPVIGAASTSFPGRGARKTGMSQDADELRVPGRSTLSRSPSLAENRMSRVGRSSDFRVRFVRPSRRRCRRIRPAYPTRQWPGDRTNLQTLGYSGGAVPELHRVPCTSAFPQEWPTTNAPSRKRESIKRRQELSTHVSVEIQTQKHRHWP